MSNRSLLPSLPDRGFPQGLPVWNHRQIESKCSWKCSGNQLRLVVVYPCLSQYIPRASTFKCQGYEFSEALGRPPNTISCWTSSGKECLKLVEVFRQIYWYIHVYIYSEVFGMWHTIAGTWRDCYNPKERRYWICLSKQQILKQMINDCVVTFQLSKGSKLSKSIVSSKRQFQHSRIVRVCHERFVLINKKTWKKNIISSFQASWGVTCLKTPKGAYYRSKPWKTALNIVVFVGPKMTPKGAWIGPFILYFGYVSDLQPNRVVRRSPTLRGTQQAFWQNVQPPAGCR